VYGSRASPRRRQTLSYFLNYTSNDTHVKAVS
jgi:hypothetical protein